MLKYIVPCAILMIDSISLSMEKSLEDTRQIPHKNAAAYREYVQTREHYQFLEEVKTGFSFNTIQTPPDTDKLSKKSYQTLNQHHNKS